MIYLFLIIASFLTAIISGLFSMAGGLVLIGVYAFFLSVPATMVLHGVTQTFSNGSRVWIYRAHIKWNVLLPYSIAAVAVLIVFWFISFVSTVGLLFLLIGSLPIVALLLPKSLHLDVQKPHIAMICGLVVTTAQMLSGVAGPLLDVFYVNSRLTRQEILGTKAMTQTLGHIIKVSYYGVLLAATETPIWLFPAVIIAALLGNVIAVKFVEKMTDTQFRMAGRYLIFLIGVVFLTKGGYELWR